MIRLIGDMCCSLPILLDEYHNILDITEVALSSRNYNSAGKDKKFDVSKRSHFDDLRDEIILKSIVIYTMSRKGSLPQSYAFHKVLGNQATKIESCPEWWKDRLLETATCQYDLVFSTDGIFRTS